MALHLSSRLPIAVAPPLLLIAIALSSFACSSSDQTNPEEVIRIRGRTMGTSYSLIAIPPAGVPLEAKPVEAAADSLLGAINAEVNTYDGGSMISRLNRGDTLSIPLIDPGEGLQRTAGAHLSINLAMAVEPYRLSEGAFDPTVGPLVEYYGFGAGFTDNSALDTAEVSRLRGLVGFENAVRDTATDGSSVTLFMRLPGSQLDLSALAKGYAVDQLGELLYGTFGVADYFVEIGGETRTRGSSPRGTPWTIGINTPEEGASTTDLEVVLEVNDAALATSGNYRNVRIRGGQRLVHTIDPRTGLAEPSSLLSATVLAEDCATADAFATACMASGESAGDLLKRASLSGCLIFAGRGGRFETRYVGDFADYVVDDDRAD